jgi:fermentation-respiration switch protein FrsA (DUF1100 family)
MELAATFSPTQYSSDAEWNLPTGAEEVFFQNAEGIKLHGWFVRPKTKPLATVLFFHGKGGNISDLGWLGESLAARGFDVLLFDYRGYGKSEGSIATEQDLYSDATAAYDYLVSQRGASPEKLVLYGHSLGTAAVADLASRNKCGAIILESGLSSASAMASSIVPWLPRWLHGLARNRFDSAKKLATVHCPSLIVHGDPDNIVPTEQGRTLYDAANEPKQLKVIPGAGHVVFRFGGTTYLDELAAFIQRSI